MRVHHGRLSNQNTGAQSLRNSMYVDIPGLTKRLLVRFPDCRLPVCGKCKKSYKTRDMCRTQGECHTDLPWSTVYVCMTLDHSCTDSENNLKKGHFVTKTIDWKPYCYKEVPNKATLICASCKTKNYTRKQCRGKSQHLHLPWNTLYAVISYDGPASYENHVYDSYHSPPRSPTTDIPRNNDTCEFDNIPPLDNADSNTINGYEKTLIQNEQCSVIDSNNISAVEASESKCRSDRRNLPPNSPVSSTGLRDNITSKKHKSSESECKIEKPDAKRRKLSSKDAVETLKDMRQKLPNRGSEESDDLTKVDKSRTFLLEVSEKILVVKWLDFDTSQVSSSSKNRLYSMVNSQTTVKEISPIAQSSSRFQLYPSGAHEVGYSPYVSAPPRSYPHYLAHPQSHSTHHGQAESSYSGASLDTSGGAPSHPYSPVSSSYGSSSYQGWQNATGSSSLRSSSGDGYNLSSSSLDHHHGDVLEHQYTHSQASHYRQSPPSTYDMYQEYYSDPSTMGYSKQYSHHQSQSSVWQSSSSRSLTGVPSNQHSHGISDPSPRAVSQSPNHSSLHQRKSTNNDHAEPSNGSGYPSNEEVQNGYLTSKY